MTYIKELACYWLANLKLSRIIVLVTLTLVLVPLFTHYYLSNVERDVPLGDVHRTRSKLETYEDFSALKATDLKLRIGEMLRIKGSVSSELRDLENKRQRLQAEVATYAHKIDQLKLDLLREQNELDRLKLSVEQAQMAYREALQRNTPDLSPPLILLPPSPPQYIPPPLSNSPRCHLSSCFDHSRCALTSGFPVYLYDQDDGFPLSPFLRTGIRQTVGYNPHYTSSPKDACVFLVLVGEGEGPVNMSRLKDLTYWGGDGRNHVLLHFSRQDLTSKYISPSPDRTGRAMVAQSTFLRNELRQGFDLVVPPILGPPGGDVWEEAVSMLPARRKIFISFQGKKTGLTTKSAYNDDEDLGNEFSLEEMERFLTWSTSDEFLLETNCIGPDAENLEWGLCGSEEEYQNRRKKILKEDKKENSGNPAIIKGTFDTGKPNCL